MQAKDLEYFSLSKLPHPNNIDKTFPKFIKGDFSPRSHIDRNS